MKLASRKQGRDGELLVVSRDLSRCLSAEGVAPNLQAALDDWSEVAPALAALAADLEAGAGKAFDQAQCASPLPRAYQWADGSAYLNHVELVRRARGAEMSDSLREDPLLYQGGSDILLGPRDPILAQREDWGVDFEAEVAVIVEDVPAGVSAAEALSYVRLVMLANDVSLRNLIPVELAKQFGFFQSKPPTAFSPVAVTPNELGSAWRNGKLDLPLLSYVNGELFGRPRAGKDMSFDFGQLIAHAAKSRPLGAGTIIGSGTVSNRPEGGPGRGIGDGGAGYSCIAELRMIETIENGVPVTPFLSFGDRVRIEMRDAADRSIFGCIDQQVRQYRR